MKTVSINDFKAKEIKNTTTIVGGTGGDIIIDKDKIKVPNHGTGS